MVDWWADDLDGDQVPESIALVCNDDTGFYLVQKGNVLLTAPKIVDSRNTCDAASRKGDGFTLHVHAAEPLTVRDCIEQPCKVTRIAKGDVNLERESQDAIDVVIRNKTFVVHFELLTGDHAHPWPVL